MQLALCSAALETWTNIFILKTSSLILSKSNIYVKTIDIQVKVFVIEDKLSCIQVRYIGTYVKMILHQKMHIFVAFLV